MLPRLPRLEVTRRPGDTSRIEHDDNTVCAEHQQIIGEPGRAVAAEMVARSAHEKGRTTSILP